MRLTLYSIPHTEELLQTSHLPLGVILQPFAKLRNDEVWFIMFINLDICTTYM